MNTWASCRFLYVLVVGLACCTLPGVATGAGGPLPALPRFSVADGGRLPPPWRVIGLPKNKVALTQFGIVDLEGERVLRVASDRSYGNLTHELADLNLEAQATLRWKWRLDQPLPDADLRRKDGDDVALKVCALFDMPLDRLGWVERNLLVLARKVSGEHLPSATLCYVWDNHLPAGTVQPNVYTRRVRYMVLNSGDAQQRQWITHERRLAMDFLLAFGSETDSVPPLIAIVVGADSDNTGGTSLGFVGDIAMKQ